MIPGQVAARVRELLGVPATVEHDEAVADVPPVGWADAARQARDGLDLALFDLLTAVDELTGLTMVVRAWSPAGRHGLRLRTAVAYDDPTVPTLTGVWAGAGWHERATAEMFGIVFAGHPSPGPLLLPDGFAGHPLRKDFVLASRVVAPWPGSVDPAPGPRRRRGPTAPGVPEGWERTGESP